MNANVMTNEPDKAQMDGIASGLTSLHLQFSTADEVVPGLDAAVQSLIRDANRNRTCGILITRNSPGDYIATLDPSVPFGETMTRIVG
ncbi:hypothetical protein [Paenarthrobacter histidinolovorans]|uniref:hypothetical protein n=1 Tax=Paenarthrobacter histidinolovorans TaxID=43664 RepID=UPI0019C53F64|nr:hypothetical protein [Paenarthrobacter histidinolovorans]GGJ22456.1 hypothetical protein GCM10010052_19440 [Paenarthrobacter histidinolovorans]